MDKNNSYEIPFGAKDSELKGWEYTVPEGMEAEIKDGKIIVREKESEDERIRKEIIDYLSTADDKELIPYESWNAWLEKQGNPKMSAEALREGIAHYGITQYQIDNWLKKYVEVESTEPKSSVLPKYGIGDVIRLKNSDHEFIIIHITDGYYHSKGAFIEIRIADDVNGDWEYVRHIQSEPKFNVGDTIIAKPENCMEHVPFHITSIESGFYWDGDDSILIDNQDEFVLVGKSVAPAHKFKVGDWVVYCGKTCKITGLNNGIFTITNQDGSYFFNQVKSTTEPSFRLWTIQDAKDGDVLCCESGWTCIFKALDNRTNTFSSYCFMDNDKWFCNTGCVSHTLDKAFIKAYNGEIHPATKKQRDLLFQKMKEAGYEWDAEKKELRKIEQNPADKVEPKFKVGDKIIEKDFDECGCGTIIDIRDGKYIFDNGGFICIEEQGLWQLVEQNPAWSEEDTINFNLVYTYVPDEALRTWLKFLKERYTWKPSDEQLEALEHSLGDYNIAIFEDRHKILTSLYQDLKKLTE